MYIPTYNQFGAYPQGVQNPNALGMYGTLPQTQQQAQTIQKIEQKPLQAMCFFVKSLDDFKVDILPGVYYLGINESAKEMYIRKMKEDGTLGLETYKLSVEKKERTELQQIVDRLSNIERQLTGLKGIKNDPRTDSSGSSNRN